MDGTTVLPLGRNIQRVAQNVRLLMIHEFYEIGAIYRHMSYPGVEFTLEKIWNNHAVFKRSDGVEHMVPASTRHMWMYKAVKLGL